MHIYINLKKRIKMDTIVQNAYTKYYVQINYIKSLRILVIKIQKTMPSIYLKSLNSWNSIYM